jgi:hypothetical protein
MKLFIHPSVYWGIFLFLLINSCIEPTLPPAADCQGVIGGNAKPDDCNHCTGGTTGVTFNYLLGCDSLCQGTQFDCDSTCGGTAKLDCNNMCNGTAHLSYTCTDTSGNGLLDIGTRQLSCLPESQIGNCIAGTSSCEFVDCDADTMYNNTVINCAGEIPGDDLCDLISGTCVDFNEYLGDEECDFLDTNCSEFNFDGEDCNLVDCTGIHFSEELCVRLFDGGCTEEPNPWLGDGFCDEGDNDLQLNFNCADWNFDNGDCNGNSRTKPSRSPRKWREILE